MNMFRTTGVTVAAAGLVIASLAPAASATPGPAFLSARQLPPSSSPWQAGPVRAGVAPDACTQKATPKKKSKHREFGTEFDTNAQQTTTVLATPKEAKALATKLRAAVRTCLARLQKQYPTLEGETRFHGRIAVEEGAHVYSLDTRDPVVGPSDIALYSVGRDGRTVTVVRWAQMGDLDHAPLAAFKKTARTSVAKLY
ncbi:hypothetical protein [Streptomyces sp. NPDC060194]|uniref:hypothetical protein n=1 Tax=Streptomyces sp. NPDC060194 TaxID=3347069 RepID=UPI00365F255D